MNKLTKKTSLTGVLCLLYLITPGFIGMAVAQRETDLPYPDKLSLKDAIRLSRSNNKWIAANAEEARAAAADYKDALAGALPNLSANGSYQRFSQLTLFEDGLSHSTTNPRRTGPDGANLGVEASFNIYAGGRQKSLQREQSERYKLAGLNTADQSGSISLQTSAAYLDLVKLYDQKRYISEQLKRAETRLKNINALYHNQKVTRSDVLRAELMLSNVQLSVRQNSNDIIIASQKLNVLMNVADTAAIVPADSAGMPKPSLSELEPLVGTAVVNSFAVRKAQGSIAIQEARLAGTKGNYMPSVSFFSAYGLNYPNTLFYPPVAQFYSIGFVGLKVQYNISSLYQNKNKVNAGAYRIAAAKNQESAVKDNASLELRSLYIKYGESVNRIQVMEKSIVQAAVNYRIISTKYFNQLALLTDLLDADNLLQESRFNLVSAQTDALYIYYRMQYAAGVL